MKLLALTVFVLIHSQYQLAQGEKHIDRVKEVACDKEGGQCKRTCKIPIDNNSCPSGRVCCQSKDTEGRQACISSEKKKCKKSKGICKASCLDSEIVIKQGCKSVGCKCCAPKVCARNQCASGEGKCVPKKKDCSGTIAQGNECSTTGKRCFCCLPGDTTVAPSTTPPPVSTTGQPTTSQPPAVIP